MQIGFFIRGCKSTRSFEKKIQGSKKADLKNK